MTHPVIAYNWTTHYTDARKYSSNGRATAAARKMLGSQMWWRIMDMTCGTEYVIDTMSGWLAK